MPMPLARYLPQLDAQPWFAALPQPLRAQLLSHAALRRLPAGHALFRRGDPPCGLYAVLSGSLTIGAVDEHGKEALLTVAGPATWFGEIALFDGLPRTHDAIALEDTLLLHVPQAALLALLDAAPHYWRDVALLMAQKLRLSFLTVEAISVMPAAQRLAARLLMIADGYGGVSAGSLRIRLSQEKLAAMLSVTRQTANQLLKSLEAGGAVRLHVGEIEIVDIDALRRASRLPDGPR
ncbi:Crp/Fnr family transcriptional regulator [Burkholderia sp. lig30]|uniref:Crp/Fnr family transcriptional regulator n=1 Tax=Burkholderia sp. lig30 TaxID=1192124 RepID=UPI0005729A1C|nr:Crp/Fnr family transcriptional regulator [Burkholderia sp. lig30]